MGRAPILENGGCREAHWQGIVSWTERLQEKVSTGSNVGLSFGHLLESSANSSTSVNHSTKSFPRVLKFSISIGEAVTVGCQ